MEGTLKPVSIFAVFAAMVALAVTPAFAVGPPADTPPHNQGTAHKPATPGPHAGLHAKAKAYGRFCKDESKKRSDAAEGTKGTPFSQCVTAMAKLAKGQSSSPRAACKDLSKKRSDAAEGTKGTPFSQCVSGGAKLLREQKAQNES
jgi:hypothetical protein